MAKLHCALTLLVSASEDGTTFQDCVRGTCTFTGSSPNSSISECSDKHLIICILFFDDSGNGYYVESRCDDDHDSIDIGRDGPKQTVKKLK